MEVTTVNGIVKTNSHVYSVTILDRQGYPYKIKAFGIDQLNNKIQKIEVHGVKEMFSDFVQQVWEHVAVRPLGEFELLIGSENLGLHPTEIEARGNLKVYNPSLLQVMSCRYTLCSEVLGFRQRGQCYICSCQPSCYKIIL